MRTTLNLAQNNDQTWLWHDYETFGIRPDTDRPAQFAAIRTDSNFNEIDEPKVWYCKPSDDYLPDPVACLITGITPQEAMEKGIREADFAAYIHQEMALPNTKSIGYNSISFDDEVSRNLFYRNFIDIYGREWQNNCSRWDIIDVIRMAHALRPDGIEWPVNQDGMPSFRLELLTEANHIEHHGAHDALSDVRATISIAKLLKSKQPALFDFALKHSSKTGAFDLLKMLTPVLYFSKIFGAVNHNMGVVTPIAHHPTNSNAIIAWDLSKSPEILKSMSGDEIANQMYSKGSPIGLMSIQTNKCPVLSPTASLRAEDVKRLKINPAVYKANLDTLKSLIGEIRPQCIKAFDSPYKNESQDVDCGIYQGFFSNRDNGTRNKVLKTPIQNLGSTSFSFDDPRLYELLFRYRGRNYPELFAKEEKLKWNQFCVERFLPQGACDYGAFKASISTLQNQALQNQTSHQAILNALLDYGEQLINNLNHANSNQFNSSHTNSNHANSNQAIAMESPGSNAALQY